MNRGLALIESLNRHYSGHFRLFVLCLDTETRDYLQTKNYKSVDLILIDEIESVYPELKVAKANRSLVEYYFTLSPVFPLYILETFNVSQITTMDADIFFFRNPDSLFREIEKHSISIIPHNFSEGLDYKEIYGKYNVSFQSFKNDSHGLQCLIKWKDQCLEWCYDTLEDEKFADQKYLNEWPDIYKNLYEIDLEGTGIAPWNLDRYIKTFPGGRKDLKDKLIFYHFHQLRFAGKNLIDLGLKDYSVSTNRFVLNWIYKPYIKTLLKFQDNQDGMIARNNLSQISLKQAFLTENNYFYYIFGLMIRTEAIKPFLSVIKRSIKDLVKKITVRKSLC